MSDTCHLNVLEAPSRPADIVTRSLLPYLFLLLYFLDSTNECPIHILHRLIFNPSLLFLLFKLLFFIIPVCEIHHLCTCLTLYVGQPELYLFYMVHGEVARVAPERLDQ